MLPLYPQTWCVLVDITTSQHQIAHAHPLPHAQACGRSADSPLAGARLTMSLALGRQSAACCARATAGVQCWPH
jgi:hypothetical protein